VGPQLGIVAGRLLGPLVAMAVPIVEPPRVDEPLVPPHFEALEPGP